MPLPLVIQICSYPALSKECLQWDFSFSLNTIKFLIPGWWELYKLPNLLPQSKYLISLLSALHFINFRSEKCLGSFHYSHAPSYDYHTYMLLEPSGCIVHTWPFLKLSTFLALSVCQCVCYCLYQRVYEKKWACLTRKLPWVTKAESHLIISIQHQADK